MNADTVLSRIEGVLAGLTGIEIHPRLTHELAEIKADLALERVKAGKEINYDISVRVTADNALGKEPVQGHPYGGIWAVRKRDNRDYVIDHMPTGLSTANASNPGTIKRIAVKLAELFPAGSAADTADVDKVVAAMQAHDDGTLISWFRQADRHPIYEAWRDAERANAAARATWNAEAAQAAVPQEA